MPRGTGSWRWHVLFGLGRLPGSEREAREYLGRRISLYFQVLFVIVGIRYVAIATLGLLGQGLPRELLTPGRLAHLVALVVVLVAWLFARRGQRTVAQLSMTEAGGTLAVGLTLATFAALIPGNQRRVELSAVLVLTQMLVARSAIVPSTAARSLVLGCACSLLLCAGMYLAGRASAPSGGVPAWIWVFHTVIWTGISVILTAVISRVIYGLQRRFEQLARLGEYVLKEKIGEGGMGIVYRASHGMLRRPTAIKLLPPERAGASAISRFEREVQITATLVHPNTIAIYDFGRTPEGIFYYAMEYVDGIDLERLVRSDGAQHPGRVVKVLKQVSAALAEAHGRGLIHRDIKPANIMLCERGEAGDFAKVLDFGLVKDLSLANEDHLSIIQGVVGTPLFLAPEAITDPDHIDGRSDIYSLGGVAYYLLTGLPVFAGVTLVELCTHHLHSPVVPPSARSSTLLPASLEALVLACLAKDPHHRPASAEALGYALESLDDVPSWTARDARSWWATRRPPPGQAPATAASSILGGVTIARDPRSRAQG